MWPNDLTQAALHACHSIRSSLNSLASEPDTLRQINRLVESIGIALDGWVQALWLAVKQAASASLALAHAWTRWMLHGNAETSAALGQALSAWWASPATQQVLGACAAAIVLQALLRRRARHATQQTRGAGAAAVSMAWGGRMSRPDDNLGDEAGPSLDANAFAASESLRAASTRCINPSTGLPMVGDTCGGVDVMGNPYGFDLSDGFGSMTWRSDESWRGGASFWD
jgi:hypothetical protein